MHKDGYNERLAVELKKKEYITSYVEEQKDGEQFIQCRIKVVKQANTNTRKK